MLDTATASPCVESYRCDPMTTAEIDAHPDRARIWATVAALRTELEGDAVQDADEIRTEAFEEGKDEVAGDVSEELSEILEAIGDESDDALRKRITALRAKL